VVVLFTGFPVRSGMLGTVLHIPLTIMLIGIVLRGSALCFAATVRTAGIAGASPSQLPASSRASARHHHRIHCDGRRGGRSAKIAGAASFGEVFVRPWAAPFPAAVGFFALALFAFLAATYLTVDAEQAELQEDFRIRALAAAAAVLVCAAWRSAWPLAAHRAWQWESSAGC
jgi:cytochrome d ubiquinol oxidase subunit II